MPEVQRWPSFLIFFRGFPGGQQYSDARGAKMTFFSSFFFFPPQLLSCSTAILSLPSPNHVLFIPDALLYPLFFIFSISSGILLVSYL